MPYSYLDCYPSAPKTSSRASSHLLQLALTQVLGLVLSMAGLMLAMAPPFFTGCSIRVMFLLNVVALLTLTGLTIGLLLLQRAICQGASWARLAACVLGAVTPAAPIAGIAETVLLDSDRNYLLMQGVLLVFSLLGGAGLIIVTFLHRAAPAGVSDVHPSKWTAFCEDAVLGAAPWVLGWGLVLFSVPFAEMLQPAHGNWVTEGVALASWHAGGSSWSVLLVTAAMPIAALLGPAAALIARSLRGQQQTGYGSWAGWTSMGVSLLLVLSTLGLRNLLLLLRL